MPKALRNYTTQALAAMMGFGLLIGLVFPPVVSPFVEWIPGRKLYFSVMCLGAGLMVGGVSFWIARTFILRRVEGVADQLRDTCIRTGDLTHRMEVRTTDVIGELGSRFNENVAHLQEIVRSIRLAEDRMSAALRDLDAKVSSTGDLMDDGRARIALIERHFADLDSSLTNVLTQMEKLSRTAQETSAAVLEQEANITEIDGQAGQMEEVVGEIVSATDQLRATNREVAGNANRMSTHALSTLELTRQMSEEAGKVAAMVAEMGEFAGQVARESDGGRGRMDSLAGFIAASDQRSEETFRVFESLKAGSRSIGEIIDVMEEIGDQTGLLALNAAIIAAQAGDEGRSFAVVAAEIRELSDKTSQSARQVGKILESLQRGIAEAHSSMMTARSGLGEGVDLSRQAKEALERIALMTRQSQERAGGVREAMSRHAARAGEIREAMGDVSRRAGEVAKAMDEQDRGVNLIGEGSHRIADLSGALKRALGEQHLASGMVSRSSTAISALSRDVAGVNADHRRRMAEVGEVIRELHLRMDRSRDLMGDVQRDRQLTLSAMQELEKEIERFRV